MVCTMTVRTMQSVCVFRRCVKSVFVPKRAFDFSKAMRHHVGNCMSHNSSNSSNSHSIDLHSSSSDQSQSFRPSSISVAASSTSLGEFEGSAYKFKCLTRKVVEWQAASLLRCAKAVAAMGESREVPAVEPRERGIGNYLLQLIAIAHGHLRLVQDACLFCLFTPFTKYVTL